ncbi:MAG TPA: hypothetical protein VJ184_00475 [Chryseolinea sp.]|nr:hypothetical protein [Chryseolinea sp.]
MFEILISSCDKYFYLWDALAFSHKHYLGEDYRKISTLISETKRSEYFPTKNYTGTWRDMVLSALKEMKSEYILYLQDDYMFYKQSVPMEFFSDIVTMCKEKEIDHLLIINDNEIYAAKKVCEHKWGMLFKRHFTGSYFASLQMGIWRREYFVELLESFNPETIWQFELGANQQCMKMDAKIYLYYNTGRVFEPDGVVYKGGWQAGIEHIKEKWLKDFTDKKEEINLLLRHE